MRLFLTFIFLTLSFLILGQNESVSVLKDSISTDSVVTCFTNDSVPFEQYDKVEIAIRLPDTLLDKVNEFVNSDGSRGINPYLEWELAVKVVFFNQSNHEKDTIDAFYYLDYQRVDKYSDANLPEPSNGHFYSDEEYSSIGQWKIIPRNFQFLARFVPMHSGNWNYEVLISVENEVKYQSSYHSFDVTPKAINPFITVSPKGREIYQNGKVFHPIGCNISWPVTIAAFDTLFANKNLSQKPDGGYISLSENYRRITVIPRVYEKYNQQILKMNRSGANWFRLIMSPQSTDIEFEKVGDYTNRLHQAKELDRFVELAHEKNFYLQWCLTTNYTFCDRPYGISEWDWDDELGHNHYGYKKKFNLVNRIDFFQNEEAIRYFKQRLRYILSRWGYSSNIGLFEVMSEINSLARPQKEDSLQQDLSILIAWQEEMAHYIKQNYFGKIHLLTNGYAGKKDLNDLSYFSDSDFDIMASNMYQFNYETSARYMIVDIARDMLDQSNDARKSNYLIHCDSIDSCKYVFKPVVLSETDPILNRELFTQNTVELNRHLWQTIFSGVTYGLSWTIWYSPHDYMLFSQMKKFNNKFSYLNLDNWHPGTMSTQHDRINDRWLFNEKAAEWMDNTKSKADLLYLINETQNSAVGVITNKTANYHTIEGLDLKGFPPNFPKAEIVNLNKEKLAVLGLKKMKYRIYYYLPDDFKHPIYVQHGVQGKKIKFNYVNLRATPETYIVIFKIVPEVRVISDPTF